MYSEITMSIRKVIYAKLCHVYVTHINQNAFIKRRKLIKKKLTESIKNFMKMKVKDIFKKYKHPQKG